MATHREQILGILRGETPDGAVIVPRLDIWYNRNRARGTLPEGFEGLTLPEIAARLGVGLHSVIPDFIRSAPAEDIYHRALGFYNNPDFPFVVDFSAVDFEVRRTDEDLTVIYHGTLGEITTRCGYGRTLHESGSSIPDILDFAVKERREYAILAEIFSRLRVIPAPGRFDAYNERVGTDGVAVAFASLACGPVHHIMRDLRRYEEFCFDMYDEPSLVAACAEPLAELHTRLLECARGTSAEVVLYGANYDETITYPPLFETQILPWLNRAADDLHAAGKFLLTHTDGENQGLLPAYSRSRFDVADSVCPAPMTKLPFARYREFFGGRTTIWGGIPSNLMLASCSSDDEFREFVRGILTQCRPFDHLILSIADTTPPDADFGRLLHLLEECRKTAHG